MTGDEPPRRMRGPGSIGVDRKRESAEESRFISTASDVSAPTTPPPASSHPHETLLGILLRTGLYTIAIFGQILIVWFLAARYGDALFSEGSLLEWLQFALACATAVVFAAAARRVAGFRQLLLILAVLPALVAIRELDKYLDAWLPGVGWQGPFFLLAAAAAAFGFRHRDMLIAQLRVFAQHRSFGILWGGFIFAIPFAQMIGHGDFLKSLFGEDYHRSFKRIIEETGETIGYSILLLGAIDCAANLRRRWLHSLQKPKEQR